MPAVLLLLSDASILIDVLVDVTLPPLATVMFPVVCARRLTDVALSVLLTLIASFPAATVAVNCTAPSPLLAEAVVIAPADVTVKFCPEPNVFNTSALLALLRVMVPVPVPAKDDTSFVEAAVNVAEPPDGRLIVVSPLAAVMTPELSCVIPPEPAANVNDV